MLWAMSVHGHTSPSRRALSFLPVALGCALLLSDAPRQADGHRGPLIVVYVGAEDCGPCRSWQRDERPTFHASSEFARLRYREIVVPQLRALLTTERWPVDLAELRERVKSRPGRRNGSRYAMATCLPRVRACQLGDARSGLQSARRCATIPCLAMLTMSSTSCQSNDSTTQ
jgi:hypothetical protein